MKQLTRFFIVALATFFVQHSKAEKLLVLKNKLLYSLNYYCPQDTAFYGNYFAAGKGVFLYSKPTLTSRTKIKLPLNVAVSVTKKSGDFVFGEFNISSNKSFKGWFHLADLKEILFTPPKITQ